MNQSLTKVLTKAIAFSINKHATAGTTLTKKIIIFKHLFIIFKFLKCVQTDNCNFRKEYAIYEKFMEFVDSGIF